MESKTSPAAWLGEKDSISVIRSFASLFCTSVGERRERCKAVSSISVSLTRDGRRELGLILG